MYIHTATHYSLLRIQPCFEEFLTFAQQDFNFLALGLAVGHKLNQVAYGRLWILSCSRRW